MFKTCRRSCCRFSLQNVRAIHRQLYAIRFLKTTSIMATAKEAELPEMEKYPEPKIENGRYKLPWGGSRPGLHNVLYGFYRCKESSGIPSEEELDTVEAMKIQKLDKERLYNPPMTGIQATWLGHASYLVQFAGINVLFDPVFSDRIGPVPYLGIGQARYRKCPVTEISELPPIDIVCISHDHYDHCDVATIKRLHEAYSDTIHWCVPMKFDEWFHHRLGLKNVNIKTFNWWQEDLISIKKEAKVAFVPAQHWCLRGYHRKALLPSSDENTRLWGGWIVKSAGKTIYHSGDTGYCHIFKRIGDKYGDIDLSMLPIGAYTPRDVLQFQHVDPEEAVQIHKDVRSKQSLAMHWGTFELTKEPYLEPPSLLKKQMEKEELEPEDFLVLKHGETRVFNA